MTKTTDPITYQRRRLVVATLGVAALSTFGYLRYGSRQTKSISTAGASTSRTNDADARYSQVAVTTKHAATHYNNAYEFGWNKTDPARHAASFHLRPWTVTFDGLVERPGTFDVDQLMGLAFRQVDVRI